MKFVKFLSVLFVLAFYSMCPADEISILKQRFNEDFQLKGEEVKTFFAKEIEDWKKSIKPDGSWSDIAYHLDDNAFTPGKHAARFDYLSRAYATQGHPHFHDPIVLQAIKKAFDFWIVQNIQSYNWWHNEIGIPQRFAKSMILLENELGPERIKAGIDILKRAEIKKTGQNRLWFSELVFIRGLFKQNKNEMSFAAQELQLNLQVANTSEEEGIQNDLSFMQHSLIYNGGYGAKFSLDTARLIKIFNASSYDFSKSKIDLISRYILDGQIWMTRGNKWDYSVTGREITRKNKNADLLTQACDILRKLNIDRKSEFQKCFEKLTVGNNYLSGNKFFWLSDYMLQQNDSYFMSVRMYSERTVNNDAPSNSEGLLSHHLADGATFLMKRGDEYQDIFPVWDWSMVPGTTSEKKRLRPAIYEPGNWDGFAHIRYMGSSRFVGGVSDGKVGIAAMDFISNKTYEKVDAKKSWNFNQNTIWALGNDIHCMGCGPVVTTIEQKKAFGEVLVMDEQGKVTIHTGDKTYDNLKGIFHDGNGYFFPYGQNVTVSVGVKKGNWNRINGQYSSDEIKENVFSAWINHNMIQIDEKYAYYIKPNISKNEFASHVLMLKFEQSEKWQGVVMGNKIYVTSFEGQQINFGNTIFDIDDPCVFIFDRVTKELTISDPSQTLRETSIKVNGKDYSVNFPVGRESGSSVSLSVSK